MWKVSRDSIKKLCNPVLAVVFGLTSIGLMYGGMYQQLTLHGEETLYKRRMNCVSGLPLDVALGDSDNTAYYCMARYPTPFVRVEIGDSEDVWETGDRTLLSCRVTQGMGQRMSNCEVVLNDPYNAIASKYFQISLDNGGIQGLPPEASPPTTPTFGEKGVDTLPSADGSTSDVPQAIIAECKRQGITAPHKIAFILAVAEGESHFNYNAYNDEGGQYGIYGGRGLVQITHKYNYKFYAKKTGENLVNDPQLAFRPDIALYILVHGVNRGWTSQGGLDKWMPNPDSNRTTAYQKIQGGVWRADYEKYYQKWLGQVGGIAATATAVQPASTGNPESPAPVTTPTAFVPSFEEIADKGRIIKVTIGLGAKRKVTEFEFIHTGTSTNKQGLTKFTGQTIRYIMNRQKKNTALKDIDLEGLARTLTEKNGFKLEPLDTNSPQLKFVDQTNITDYQLLLRETEWQGYQVKEKGAKIIIEPPKTEDSGIVLTNWENVLNFQVEDKATSQLNPISEGSGSFQTGVKETVKDEAKFDIDIESGELTQSLTTAKKSMVKGITASVATAANINTTEGEATKPAVSSTNQSGNPMFREVTKRVEGLPSQFSAPTTEALLKLEPGQAVTTKGFTETLDRKWIVRSFTHNYANNHLESSLEMYTPMTAKVLEPIQPVSLTMAATGEPAALGEFGSWSHPMENPKITCGAKCKFGYARGRLHAGVDLYSTNGNPAVYASSSGVVTVSKNDHPRGYGKWIEIKHPNGWKTRYGHNSQNMVNVGDQVQQGQQIAVWGTTGSSTGNHLHFETRNPSGQPIDPQKVIPGISG